MIYFIQDSKKNIKIGFSKNPQQRILSFHTHSIEKFTLIKSVHGTVRDEKEIHKNFAHLKISGEWFIGSEELVLFIHQYTGSEDPIVCEEESGPQSYDILHSIGVDIIRARKRSKLTQLGLAKIVGIHINTLRKLERGDSSVSSGLLLSTLCALKIDGYYFCKDKHF